MTKRSAPGGFEVMAAGLRGAAHRLGEAGRVMEQCRTTAIGFPSSGMGPGSPRLCSAIERLFDETVSSLGTMVAAAAGLEARLGAAAGRYADTDTAVAGRSR